MCGQFYKGRPFSDGENYVFPVLCKFDLFCILTITVVTISRLSYYWKPLSFIDIYIFIFISICNFYVTHLHSLNGLFHSYKYCL